VSLSIQCHLLIESRGLSARLSDWCSLPEIRRAVKFGTVVGAAAGTLMSVLCPMSLRADTLFGALVGTEAAALSLVYHECTLVP
jgi:hypothetical protein